MDNEERKNYIGGSDCAGILGLSRWTTPLKIWAEKTGQIVPEDISQKLYVKLGNKLEEAVCDLFTEETGLKVRRVNEAITHSKYDFIKAHIDRKIVGQDDILEAKTCSAWKSKEWEGEEIPQEYILQCYHYLLVTGAEKCYIAVLIGNQDFKWKEIKSDENILSDILEREIYFWNTFVIPKEMPMTITKNDDDILYQLFPNAEQGKEIELPDNANQLIEQLESFNQDKKVVDSQIKKIKNELKALIKENEIGNTGLYRIKWSNIHKDPYQVKEQNYRNLTYKKLLEGK